MSLINQCHSTGIIFTIDLSQEYLNFIFFYPLADTLGVSRGHGPMIPHLAMWGQGLNTKKYAAIARPVNTYAAVATLHSHDGKPNIYCMPVCLICRPPVWI